LLVSVTLFATPGLAGQKESHALAQLRGMGALNGQTHNSSSTPSAMLARSQLRNAFMHSRAGARYLRDRAGVNGGGGKVPSPPASLTPIPYPPNNGAPCG
jgi:hypothetical protein